MKLKSLFSAGFPGDFIALIAGALLPLAFAPVGFYPLAIISPALLLALWLNISPKQAFLRGLYFGIGLFGFGASWIFIAIHRYGDTNIFISILTTIIFILILAILPAFQGYFLTRFFTTNNRTKIILAFPASWVLFEWIRSWYLSGFPWLFLGYSQTNSPLHTFAPIIGLYGVSFIVALCSGLVVMAFNDGWRGWYKSLLPLVLIWIVALLLSPIHWTHPVSPTMNVALIQGNIPQSTKWNPQQAESSLNIYQQLTQPYWNSDLIIWPESAITFLLPDAVNYLDQLNVTAQQHHTALLTGIPNAAPDFKDNTTAYYNSMIVVGDGHGIYNKQHLVPFGEYVPFQNLLRGLFGFLNLPMSDFSTGASHQPLLVAHGIFIAPFICYEIVYPNLVMATLPQAELLVTISDDTWFGDSFAPGQHLQMGQFWALASGRYLINSTNSGTTAIVNPNGTLQNTAPPFQAIVLPGKVYAMQGLTPAIILGNLRFIIGMLLLLMIAWFFQLKYFSGRKP